MYCFFDLALAGERQQLLCVDAAVKDDLFPVGSFQPARLHVRRFGLDRVQDLNAAVHQVVDQPVYASAGMVQVFRLCKTLGIGDALLEIRLYQLPEHVR